MNLILLIFSFMVLVNFNKFIKIFIYMETLGFILLILLSLFSFTYFAIFSVLLVQVLESIIIIISLLNNVVFWKLSQNWIL